MHFPNHSVDSNANELTKFGKSLGHVNLENKEITQCLVTSYMATRIWVNIGSDNGLLPDGHQAIT